MMRDRLVLGTLVLACAVFFTAHVTLALRLAIRVKPWWRGVLALFLAPLAPVWGVRAQFRKHTILWGASLAVYVVARLVAG